MEANEEDWSRWQIEEANGTGDFEYVLHDTPEDCLFDGIHSGLIDTRNHIKTSTAKRKSDGFRKADYGRHELKMIDGLNQVKKESAKRFAKKFKAKQKELEKEKENQ